MTCGFLFRQSWALPALSSGWSVWFVIACMVHWQQGHVGFTPSISQRAAAVRTKPKHSGPRVDFVFLFSEHCPQESSFPALVPTDPAGQPQAVRGFRPSQTGTHHPQGPRPPEDLPDPPSRSCLQLQIKMQSFDSSELPSVSWTNTEESNEKRGIIYKKRWLSFRQSNIS